LLYTDSRADHSNRAPDEHVASASEKPLHLIDRLALRPKEAAAVLGLSERAFRSLLPSLPHVRAGSAVLIPVDALRRWLEERTRIETSRVDAIVTETLRSIQR
jgi:excisionase family DNA binding protein